MIHQLSLIGVCRQATHKQQRAGFNHASKFYHAAWLGWQPRYKSSHLCAELVHHSVQVEVGHVQWLPIDQHLVGTCVHSSLYIKCSAGLQSSTKAATRRCACADCSIAMQPPAESPCLLLAP